MVQVDDITEKGWRKGELVHVGIALNRNARSRYVPVNASILIDRILYRLWMVERIKFRASV